LKKLNGKNYVERTVIRAIKQDIAIYAIHTNLDNVVNGVSGKMGEMLGLANISVLAPKQSTLKKLYTFVPVDKADEVRAALFFAGAGHIGHYSECSFNAEGTGTFKGDVGSNPYVGKPGLQHAEKEMRIEVVFPAFLEGQIVSALKAAHPYEEVAYDIINLANAQPGVGSGVVGEFEDGLPEGEFLTRLKTVFKTSVIKHTSFTGRKVKRVALCGGSGSFLIDNALAAKADAYVTADMKYHEFFDADGRLLIADIGHYESEQFTIDLLQAVLAEKFLTFAVLKTGVITNPVKYFS
jgi:hypothetical protein